MEINKITAPQTKGVELTKKEPIKETGLKKDSFDKQKEVFNPEEATKFLKEIKNEYGTKKFTYDGYVKTIVEQAEKEPTKWQYLKELAPRPNISGFFLEEFSQRSVDDLKLAVELASVEDSKGKPKFQGRHVRDTLELDTTQRANVKVMQNCALNVDNIIKAAQEKDLDCKKVASKANEMANTIGEKDLKEVTFTRDEYSKGDYKLIGTKNNDNKITELLDKNINRYALETTETYATGSGKKYTVRKVSDDRNNTTSKVRYEYDKSGYPNVTHEIRIVKDKKGKTQRVEYTQPSEINGVMDIKYMYPNGKEEQISSGTVDKKTGITSIKKNMVSSLGTKTEYLFEDDPEGNRISDYKITDKNGNVLLQNSESFEVIDKNHFISSKNGQKYEIIADDLSTPAREYSVTVKDLNNPERVAKFSTSKEITGDYKEMIKVLKKMPGEELFKLKENTKKLHGITDVLKSYSLTDKYTREIHTGDDLFVILHELGHAVDMKDVDMTKKEETIHKAIFEDKKFNEIYAKEKEAFNKAFPNAQRDHIDYFINHETHYQGEIGGRKETIAEANALLTTAKSHEVLAMRSQYLQQHFPETIAYLDKKLAEPAENPNRTYEQKPNGGWFGGH